MHEGQPRYLLLVIKSSMRLEMRGSDGEVDLLTSFQDLAAQLARLANLELSTDYPKVPSSADC